MTEATHDAFAGIQNAFAHVEAMCADCSQKIVAAFKGLDDLTMAALDAAGNLMQAGVMKLADGMANAASKAGSFVAKTADVMDRTFTPPSTPGLSQGNDSPSQGKSQELNICRSQYGEEIGQIKPMHTPSMGVAMGQGRSMC